MSTVSTSVVPVHFRNRSCCRCGQPTDGTTCNLCLVGQAEHEAVKLNNDLRDLVNGRGVFWVLPAVTRAGLLLKMGFTPASVAPFVSDKGLADVLADPRSSEGAIEAAAGELLRRVPQLVADDGSPGAIERAQIERAPDHAHIDAQEFAGERWDGQG